MFLGLFRLAVVLALPIGACSAAGPGGDRPATGETAVVMTNQSIPCMIEGLKAREAETHDPCEAFRVAAEQTASGKIASIKLEILSPYAATATVELVNGAAPLHLRFDSMDRVMTDISWRRFAETVISQIE